MVTLMVGLDGKPNGNPNSNGNPNLNGNLKPRGNPNPNDLRANIVVNHRYIIGWIFIVII